MNQSEKYTVGVIIAGISIGQIVGVAAGHFFDPMAVVFVSIALFIPTILLTPTYREVMYE
jgi:ABC-type dipeptide/oligopeptide/nickel transport system permease subunit